MKVSWFSKENRTVQIQKISGNGSASSSPQYFTQNFPPPNLFLIKNRLPSAIHLACQKNSKLLHHNSKWKSGLKINIDSFLHYEIRRKIERIEKSILSWIILPFYSFVMKLDIDYFLLFEIEKEKNSIEVDCHGHSISIRTEKLMLILICFDWYIPKYFFSSAFNRLIL